MAKIGLTKMAWGALVIVHRYLGVAVGLLMVMWFVSGIVMMYVGFPRVSEDERLRALPTLPWQDCCQFGERVVGDGESIQRAQVENLAGAPVLRLRRPGRVDTPLDLAHGTVLRIDSERARAVVIEAAPRILGRTAAIVAADRIDVDQWTVGRLFRDRPLFRFKFDDPARTIIYVSGTSGQAVHWTNATQRFWNWLGTIPHWLYFTELRSDVALWSQIMIWTSILGTFLTVLGLYLGISQFRRSASGKLSPYRGLFYWHHLAGLVFGIVTLTWVVSGLVSMNPGAFWKAAAAEAKRRGSKVRRRNGARCGRRSTQSACGL